MADEEKTAEEETPAEEAPATEAEPQNDDAAGDTPREAADEAADVDVDEAPEADEPEAAAPAPAAEPEEPAEQLGPKERRRRERSAHSGEALPPRTVEERIAERAEARKAKAAERRRYRQGRGKARRQAAGEGTGTAPAEREPGNPKVRQGIVVSDKADKTITVRVESARRHPSYEKIIRRSKMVHAHDERNEAGPGDTVRLIETRPMSKTKHWRLTEILEKAK